MNEWEDWNYLAALCQTAEDPEHVVGRTLGEADACLSELERRGRYPRDAAPTVRGADRLGLALALMRARREGVEAGVRLEAWWREAMEREGSAQDEGDRAAPTARL